MPELDTPISMQTNYTAEANSLKSFNIRLTWPECHILANIERDRALITNFIEWRCYFLFSHDFLYWEVYIHFSLKCCRSESVKPERFNLYSHRILNILMTRGITIRVFWSAYWILCKGSIPSPFVSFSNFVNDQFSCADERRSFLPSKLL